MTADVIDFQEKALQRRAAPDLSRQLMQMPARMRLDSILSHPDSQALVGMLAEQDFYLFLKELGSDDALELLALANADQLNHVFDLEWWNRDQVASDRALEWLERLVEARVESFLGWFYQADFELLVTLFKQWVRVEVVPEEADLVEVRDLLPKQTLDDQFFWEARDPRYEAFVRSVLDFLFQQHHGFYAELLQAVILAGDTEMEEDAYRFHRGRLEDRAVPDFYDALEIYRPRRAEDLPRDKAPIDHAPSQLPVPCFALVEVPDEDLLHAALEEIHDYRVQDLLKLELAALANKVVVADGLEPDDAGQLRQAAAKVAACLSLGLGILSAGDPKAAARHLQEVYLQYLFQLGQTPVAQIKQRLERICSEGWLARWPGGISLLDREWAEAARLLLQQTPRLVRPERRRSHLPAEDFFRTPADVQRTEQLVDVIESLESLFVALEVRPERLRRLWQGGLIRELSDVTLEVLLWTAAAQFALEGQWAAEPIPVRAWPELYPRLGAEALEWSISAWISRSIDDPERIPMVRAYVSSVAKTYAEEMAPFPPKQPPEPHLVAFFLFKDE